MAVILTDEEGPFPQVQSHTGIQATGAQGKRDKLSIGRTLFVLMVQGVQGTSTREHKMSLLTDDDGEVRRASSGETPSLFI